jgi:hypothetical protein
VASLFAYHFPECVVKLGLLCPAVRTPILTEACLQVVDGQFEHLIPKDGVDLSNICHLLTNDYHKRFPCSDRIMQSMVNVNYAPRRQKLLRERRSTIFLRPNFLKYSTVF